MPTADLPATAPTSIAPAELTATLAGLPAYALLDVRERGEYALGHIPNACPVPRGLLEVLLPTLIPWHDVPVVLYCDDGHRTALAAQTLAELGYTDVRVLTGGIDAWRAAGNEPEEGVNVLGKAYGERISAAGEVDQIEPDELAELTGTGEVLVIDARTPVEYDRGHIPGAVNVPGGELAHTLLGLADEVTATRPVVVHCAGRTRSILGAHLVGALGVPRVHALRNGTMAWRMSGRELEFTRNELDLPTTSQGRERAAAFARSQAPGEGWSLARLAEAEAAGAPLYIVDVRRPEEFTAGHLPGAISCPAGQLANAVDEQLAVRGAQIVCYSSSETRARIGTATLRRIGYPHVTWLTGGYQAWLAGSGRPETGRRPSWPAELADRLPDTPGIEVTELAERIAGDTAPVILDVRRSSEYALGHLPGSVWVPRGDLERRLSAQVPAGPEVVVVSDRGIRAALAAPTVTGLGRGPVRLLTGGLEAWIAAGRELEQGLAGAEVALREAKEDAELVAPRPPMLERNTEDMVRYLTWEEQLGHSGTPAGTLS